MKQAGAEEGGGFGREEVEDRSDGLNMWRFTRERQKGIEDWSVLMFAPRERVDVALSLSPWEEIAKS